MQLNILLLKQHKALIFEISSWEYKFNDILWCFDEVINDLEDVKLKILHRLLGTADNKTQTFREMS